MRRLALRRALLSLSTLLRLCSSTHLQPRVTEAFSSSTLGSPLVSLFRSTPTRSRHPSHLLSSPAPQFTCTMPGDLNTQAPAKLPIIADLAALPRVPDPVPSPSNEPALDELTAQFTQALYDIRSKLPEELKTPRVAIVCGSGLQGLADILQDRVEVPYGEITGFGESTGEFNLWTIAPSCSLTPSFALISQGSPIFVIFRFPRGFASPGRRSTRSIPCL